MSRDHASFWYALPNVAVTLDNATDDPPPPPPEIRCNEPLLTDGVPRSRPFPRRIQASLFSSRIFESGAFHDIFTYEK